MRVLVHLSNPVPAFEPTREQLGWLSARARGHEISSVQTDPEFLEALPEADAVVVWRFPGDWYPGATRLRHVFTPAAGREGFAPDPSGRVERHFGRFHGAIMAESLLAMITFMNRRLAAALRAQSERRWDRTPYSSTRRLHGQVALIIGYGAIGQRCGALLSAIGMVVHALRRDISRPSPWARRVFGSEQLLDAVALADHVICVLPSDTGTNDLIDAAALSHLKRGACVYNVGRGNAVALEPLRDALWQGRIAGAFLDVLPEEPLPATSTLWTTPNLYLTPHCSAISAEYIDAYFEELAAELAALS